MKDSGLRLERSGAVAHLVLDRPERRHALSPALLDHLVDACTVLSVDAELRAVVLRSTGPVFSAGADLPEFMGALAGPEALDVAELGRRATDALAGLPQPKIAVIDGACVGGGLVLASACDLRIASCHARFRVPELALGVPLAWGGTARLVRLVGMGRATDWILSARWIEIEEAEQAGLVSRVVEVDALDDEVARLADTLARRPRSLIEVTRRQLGELEAGLEPGALDAEALVAALADPECQAAAARYLAGDRDR